MALILVLLLWQVFEMAMVLDDTVPTHYPLLKIPARSKLSSLCWNGYIKSSLICADYDGVIQLWDIASASDVMQFDEHTRRVWSVDFSQVGPVHHPVNVRARSPCRGEFKLFWKGWTCKPMACGS